MNIEHRTSNTEHRTTDNPELGTPGPRPSAPVLSSSRFHLAGVAGVGMSALAQALLDRGAAVSGSDRFLDGGREIDALRVLRAAGVRLVPQDGSGLMEDTTALVISTAVEEGNPDLEAARRLGVPVVHRAAMLARLASGRRGIAIAGTSGKTTVTGMTGWVFECLGLDPAVVNGGAVLNWAAPTRLGSVRSGASDWFVFEADESDRSFLQFSPEHAILTNITQDHFALDEAVALFREFATRVAGTIVAGPGVGGILGPEFAGCVETPVASVPPRVTPSGVEFDYEGVHFAVPMIGVHNGWNALLVAGLARRLGLDLRAVAEAFRSFRGIHRRLEIAGDARGVLVIDDYAHNPAKMRAAWEAAATRAKSVIGVWRPHGFGPLRLMLDDLAGNLSQAMRPADRLVLLPVFYAGGTPGGSVNSDELARRLRSLGREAAVVPDYAALEARVLPHLVPGSALLVMGARDPDLPLFARRVAARLSESPAGQRPAS